MLKGKNVVIVKGDKDNATQVKEYDRVYLEYGPGDPLEEYSKTSDGKDLTVEGKLWKGTKPKNAQTSTPVEALMEDALAFFNSEYPSANPANAATHAYIKLLEAASYGSDLWRRNKIQADIRPSKPVDKAAAITKMAKLLMAMNPKMTQAKALAVATAATESE